MANDKVKKLSALIHTEEPPTGMYERICANVERAELTRLRARAIIYAAFSLASIVVLVPTLASLIDRFTLSGFSQYLSLASSDTSYVLHNLGTFALSLVDSLPLSIGILTLLVIFIFANSIYGFMRYRSYMSKPIGYGYYPLQNH